MISVRVRHTLPLREWLLTFRSIVLNLQSQAVQEDKHIYLRLLEPEHECAAIFLNVGNYSFRAASHTLED